MAKEIQNFIRQIKRPILFLAAVSIMAPVSSMAVVFASAGGGQVQSRQIIMSDSGVSGAGITSGVGSGTGVTYRVVFKAATAYTVKGIILDFCSGTGGTPFIGDSNCPAPAGFSVGTPTLDTSDYTLDSGDTATGLTGGWTAASVNSGQTLKLTSSTGMALATGATDYYTFDITGVTNPSELGTFYARLMTYTSGSGDIDSYAHDTPGTYQDYGGFALSTTNAVQVTAKVQEALTFCVVGTSTPRASVTDPIVLTAPVDCTHGPTVNGSPTTPTAPAITLGHSGNNTLDATAVDTNGVFSYASTNALNGLVIRMHNSNSCGGLSGDDGTTCAIPAIGAGSATPSAMAAGTAAFGMFCNQPDATKAGGSDVACDGGYDDSANQDFPNGSVYYGMDTTTTGANVASEYGDTVASSTGPTNGSVNEFDFAATASNTTPAGIYKANLSMIATGTF